MDVTKIIDWYSQNKRDLPWRHTKDPYKIWLSEIILQQTQVTQGLPYYHRFITAYPDVHRLASASEQEVLNLWQGLGYYSRARNLHYTAKDIVNNYQGIFPKTYNKLLKLKGIGEYTAAAIASFCYNEPIAVLDGNVYRVLARIFGIDTPINSTEGKKIFKNLAQKNIYTQNPAIYNQAIMEFGALLCKPTQPKCDICPVSKDCIGYQTGKTNKLPIKLSKNKIKNRYLNYFLVTWQHHIVLEKREKKDIWQNLYQLPLIETPNSKLFLSEELELLYKKFQISPVKEPELIEKAVHKLTHQHLHIIFWQIQSKQKPLKAILKKKIKDYPLPIVIANLLHKYR